MSFKRSAVKPSECENGPHIDIDLPYWKRRWRELVEWKMVRHDLMFVEV
jgi:hypothetical protein